MKNNNSGYVMGFVVITMMVVFISLSFSLSLSMRYHEKERVLQTQNQTYYTSRTMLEAIVDNFCNPDSKIPEIKEIILKEMKRAGEEPFIISVEGMGSQLADECDIFGEYRLADETLILGVTVVKDGQTRQVRAMLKKEGIDRQRSGGWKLIEYFE